MPQHQTPQTIGEVARVRFRSGRESVARASQFFPLAWPREAMRNYTPLLLDRRLTILLSGRPWCVSAPASTQFIASTVRPHPVLGPLQLVVSGAHLSFSASNPACGVGGLPRWS